MSTSTSLPARGVRVGGVTITPGTARAVEIPLAPRDSEDAGAAKRPSRAMPAWVAVGAKPGPRVTVVAAARGTESAATAAARALAHALDPATMAGSVVVVPVLRPGGRFAPRRRPASAWTFPGDTGGGARARDAFTVFSELVVGAAALVELGAPRGGRRAALTVRGDLDDPRVRRLVAECGALAATSTKRVARGSIAAAARAAGVVALELSAADSPVEETRAARALEAATFGVLTALGIAPAAGGQATSPSSTSRARPTPPATVDRPVRVRATVGGLVEAAVPPGTFVRAGAILARLAPTLPGRAVSVKAPVDAIVLEAPARPATRKGTPLYVLAPLPAGARRPRAIASAAAGDTDGSFVPLGNEASKMRAGAEKLRAGWVEHVTLPDLAIPRLKAKLDTGARTSALHVARMRTVDTAGGPARRPILEITVPGGGRGRKPHRVRAAVRGYVVVRDTSGRMERRPVIETALGIGPVKKRIAVTLTNRGDMLFPMLIGRTALGSGFVVDPARRYLLGA
jgi:predicted deacylase